MSAAEDKHPVFFTFPLGFYRQEPDSGMTQRSESAFSMLYIDVPKGSSCFSPLKLQYTVRFSQLEWLQGCNRLIIITIIKVVAEFL